MMAALTNSAEMLLHTAEGVRVSTFGQPDVCTRTWPEAATDIVWSVDGSKLLVVLKDRVLVVFG
jgi:hypothetical protein